MLVRFIDGRLVVGQAEDERRERWEVDART
jgi:hypothetical protein